MAPKELEHRLAAILSADAVGYSRLMADDGDATVRTLGAYRSANAESVGRHGGRLCGLLTSAEKGTSSRRRSMA